MSVFISKDKFSVTWERWRIMSQSGAAFCFLRVDEKVDVGSEMYLLDTDARGSEARQDLHQHLSLDGARQALVHRFTPGFIYWAPAFCGLSCHWVRRCTEAAISPISQIMAGKYQLVFHPTVNKDKYQRAAQPSQLPPTQYFWWAIRCPGHVLLRFNRLIWINSHLSDSGDRGSINISAPLWLLSQNGAKVSTVCYTCYTFHSHSCSRGGIHLALAWQQNH